MFVYTDYPTFSRQTCKVYLELMLDKNAVTNTKLIMCEIKLFFFIISSGLNDTYRMLRKFLWVYFTWF